MATNRPTPPPPKPPVQNRPVTPPPPKPPVAGTSPRPPGPPPLPSRPPVPPTVTEDHPANPPPVPPRTPPGMPLGHKGPQPSFGAATSATAIPVEYRALYVAALRLSVAQQQLRTVNVCFMTQMMAVLPVEAKKALDDYQSCEQRLLALIVELDDYLGLDFSKLGPVDSLKDAHPVLKKDWGQGT